jgi:hypothetical protein
VLVIVDSQVNAITASLDLSGGAPAAAVGTIAYAQGLRAGIAAVLNSASSGNGSASGSSGSSRGSSEGSADTSVLIDMVFISSLTDYGTGTRSTFSDKDPLNKAGNYYNTTAEVINSLGAGALAAFSGSSGQGAAGGAGSSSSGGGSGGSGSISGSGGSGASSRRGLGGSLSLQALLPLPLPPSPTAAAPLGRRRLDLSLQPAAAPLPRPNPARNGSSSVTFNILARSAGAAAGFKATLTALAPSDMGAIAAAVAAATGNSTEGLVLAIVPGSVQVVLLTYRQSFWGLFLEFFYRNIRNVLGSAIFLLCAALFLYGFKVRQGSAGKAARARAANALKEAWLAEAQGEVRRGVARARWRAVLRKVRVLVRCVLLLHRVRGEGWRPRAWPGRAPAAAASARAAPPPLRGVLKAQRSPVHVPRPVLTGGMGAGGGAGGGGGGGGGGSSSSGRGGLAASLVALPVAQPKQVSLKARARLRALQPFLKAATGSGGGEGGWGGGGGGWEGGEEEEDSLGALMGSPQLPGSVQPTLTNPGGAGGSTLSSGGSATYSTGGSLVTVAEEGLGRGQSPTFA